MLLTGYKPVADCRVCVRIEAVASVVFHGTIWAALVFVYVFIEAGYPESDVEKVVLVGRARP